MDEEVVSRYIDYQSRFQCIMDEAFIESQATMKVQVGFYLAFCYVNGLPGEETALQEEYYKETVIYSQFKETQTFSLYICPD